MESVFTKSSDWLNRQLTDPSSALQKGLARSLLLTFFIVLLLLPVILVSFLLMFPVGIAYRFGRWVTSLCRRLFGGKRARKTVGALLVVLAQIPFAFAILVAGLVFLHFLTHALHRGSYLDFYPQYEIIASRIVFGFAALFLAMLALARFGDGSDPKDIDLEEAQREHEDHARYSSTNERLHPLFRNPQHLRFKRRLTWLANPAGMLFMLNFMLCNILLLSSLILFEGYQLWGDRLFLEVPPGAKVFFWLKHSIQLLLRILPLNVFELFGLSLSPARPTPPLGTGITLVINLAATWLVLVFFYSIVKRMLPTSGKPAATAENGAAGPQKIPDWIDGKMLVDSGAYSLENDRFDEAIARFTKAIELDPMDPACYCARGKAYFLAGRFKHAVLDYNAAIGIDKDDAEALYGRGISHHRGGNPDEAVFDLARVIQQQPDAWKAYYEAGKVALEIEDYEMAVDCFLVAIDNDIDLRSSFPWLAVAYVANGQNDEAIDWLNTITEDAPPDLLNWFLVARAYLGMGDFNLAIASLRRSGKQDAAIVRWVTEDPAFSGWAAEILERMQDE